MNTLKPHIFLILLSMSSHTATCQVSKALSEVTFYGKPDFIYGNLSQVRFKIRENGKSLFNLKVNTAKIALVEPGLKTFSARNLWMKDEFVLDIKPNHRYLIEVKSGIFFPKIRLVNMSLNHIE